MHTDLLPSKHQRYAKIALTLLIGSSLWAALCSSILGLSDQEAYYWTWSRQLSWGYLEHPAMQAWITRLLTTFFGNDPWVIRLPCFLLGRFVGFYYLWKWLQQRFNEDEAFVSFCLILSTSFMIAGSIIALPDAFLFPFVCMAIYFSERKNGFMSGVSLGLCGFAKLTGVFIAPGVLMAFWNKKNAKTSFLSITKVGLLALVFQLPTFYWNYKNNWDTFRFHLFARHPQFHWTLANVVKNLLGFSLSQILLGGLGFATLCVFWLASLSKKSSPQSSKLSNPMPLWPWIVPAFLVVGYSATRGELRFYWTAPTFLLLIPLMIHFCFSRKRNAIIEHSLTWSSFVSLGLGYAVCSMLLFLPVGEYLRPVIEKYRSYDIRFSPRGDIEGWRELVSHLKESGEMTGNAFAVAGSDFRLTSQIAWAAHIDDMNRVYVGAPTKSQFGYWDLEKSAPFPTEAYFVADNRYVGTQFFPPLCDEHLEWKDFQYTLGGYVIKTIRWSHCKRFHHRI